MIKRNIPNAITCGNLICGCLAIINILQGELIIASYLVGLAAVLDFFDGFAARLLKVSSPIGKDLDSLADVVTFGVVPGFMMLQLINLSQLNFNSEEFINYLNSESIANNSSSGYLKYLALTIPVFSAVRLAKFNNDQRQSDSFIGLPTPANAILIVTIPHILNNPSLNFGFLQNPAFLIVLTLVLSYLLIAELPLFALKFKSFTIKGNEIRYIFLALSAISIVLLGVFGITIAIILYVILSLINNLLVAKHAK